MQSLLCRVHSSADLSDVFLRGMGPVDLRGDYRYNLVPFREIRRYLKYRGTIGSWRVFLNLAGNVVGFMPFGSVASSPEGEGCRVLEDSAFQSGTQPVHRTFTACAAGRKL